MKIPVFVHPNSKKPRIYKDLLGSLHVYVNQPPVEGKANKAVINALLKYFNIRKHQIAMVRGEKSKQKIFEIQLAK